MKVNRFAGLLVLAFLATSCAGAGAGREAAATVSAMKTERAALGPTAVFQTAVSARLTQDAPPPSSTPEPTEAPTTTPTSSPTAAPSPTPDASPTPESETSKNPWILQPECEDNPNCAYVQITNKTPGWFQITITSTETGEAGFFSVRSQGFATIHLLRGEYRASMTLYCSGTAYTQNSFLPGNNSYQMTARCPSMVQIVYIPE